MTQLFKVDPFQPTVRVLDLSMRLYRSNIKESASAKKALVRPDFFEDQEYFDYYRSMKGHDDEQRMLIMALHYNTHKISTAPRSDAAGPKLYYLKNSVVTLNLSSNWVSTGSLLKGVPSAQSLMFSTLANFENLNELLYNNNSIKGERGPLEFFQAVRQN
jgi:hypothetical protein